MNNQFPYGYMPPFNNTNINYDREIKMLNDRIDLLEKQIKRLDKRLNSIENNNNYYPRPMPYSNNENNYPNNNYMI